MKKDFIKGFIISALLFGSINAFADNLTAITASFPVLIDNQIFTTDKPIVTINGSTYLPLKAIGEALNVQVIWNNNLRQVEITTKQENHTTFEKNTTDEAIENYKTDSIAYIGNKNTKKLHISTCSAASKITDSNKVFFSLRTDATGYVPCKICNP